MKKLILLLVFIAVASWADFDFDELELLEQSEQQELLE
jgi:hypothetical protein